MSSITSFFKDSISVNTSETRLATGLLFLRFFGALALLRTHGLPKALDIKSTMEHIPDPIGMGATFATYYAIFANVLCALFIMVGLGTRWAALAILSITLSGLFLVHAADPAKVQDTPLIYSIVFITLAILGSGKFSVDALLQKKLNA